MERRFSLPGQPRGDAHRRSRPMRLMLAALLAATPAAPARALDSGTPPGPSAATAAGLTYWIELLEAPVGPGPQVPPDHIFHAGERIRLHVRCRREGFVWLVRLPASGEPERLFPGGPRSVSDDRIRANEDRVLPAESSWFSFDDEPGNEQLVLLFAATREELERLQKQVRQPEARGLAEGLLHIELKRQ